MHGQIRPAPEQVHPPKGQLVQEELPTCMAGPGVEQAGSDADAFQKQVLCLVVNSQLVCDPNESGRRVLDIFKDSEFPSNSLILQLNGKVPSEVFGLTSGPLPAPYSPGSTVVAMAAGFGPKLPEEGLTRNLVRPYLSCESLVILTSMCSC